MSDPVQLESYSNRAVILRIHRPRVRNALSWEAMEKFAHVVEQVQNDSALCAMIVTGGSDVFCAGGDLKELQNYLTHADGERLSRLMGEALDRLSSLPFLTIAAVEGPAIGGGAEIALACDMRVVAESVKFGLTHVRLGIGTAWGGSPRLVQLVGYARALEWQTKGVILSGSDLHSHGLANALVKDGSTLEKAQAIVDHIASHDPAAVRGIKRTLITTDRQGFRAGARVERQVFPELWAAPAHITASEVFNKKKGG